MTPSQREWPEGAVMAQFVIYKFPRDFPSDYVMRAHFIMNNNTVVADSVAWRAPTIEGLHAILPPGLTRLEPMPGDDPVIFEVWI